MSLFWVVFLFVLACGLLPVFRQLTVAPRLISLLTLLGIATAISAYALSQRADKRSAAEAARFQTIPQGDRGDGFAHSESCASCHPREHETWFKSFHRTMTQIASPENILGKFDADLEWAGEKYHFGHDAEGAFVEMTDPLWKSRQPQRGLENALVAAPRIKTRPALLTGSHHMQVCWMSPGLGKTQVLIPFAWLNADQRWAPFDQTFLRDPAMPHTMQIWNKSCAECHTTAPLPLYYPEKGDVRTTVGELGIACEACHGDGEAHVNFHHNPVNRYLAHTSTTSSASAARLVNPAKLDSKKSSDVCGRCHSVKWFPNYANWNKAGLDFHPGDDLAAYVDPVQPAQMHGQEWTKSIRYNPTYLSDRYWKDGMVRVSGREYNGLVESPCYKKGNLACVSCHSMHNSDPDDQLAARMNSNEACLQCHTKMRATVEAHTHHRTDSSGSLCYNCHMPFTTYGLLKGIRSHQITSPDIRVAKDTGRPDACTLCHLDKSSQWAAQNLSQWFAKKIPTLTEDEKELPASTIHALKGDAGQRALIAFAMGWSEAQKVAKTAWLPPFLGELMDDPYPAVRYIANRSLKTLPTFQKTAFDFTIPPAQRAPVAPTLSTTAEKKLSPAKISELINARDNTSIDLQE